MTDTPPPRPARKPDETLPPGQGEIRAAGIAPRGADGPRALAHTPEEAEPHADGTLASPMARLVAARPLPGTPAALTTPTARSGARVMVPGHPSGRAGRRP